MKTLVFWLVTLSLVSVLFGNYVAFHIESDASKISSQENQIVKSGVDSSEGHHADPCDQGHCHLGHCALTFESAYAVTYKALYPVTYNSQDFNFVSRFLDGPNEPPRMG